MELAFTKPVVVAVLPVAPVKVKPGSEYGLPTNMLTVFGPDRAIVGAAPPPRAAFMVVVESTVPVAGS